MTRSDTGAPRLDAADASALFDPAYGAALISTALRLAGRGWFVLPLRPGLKRPATPQHAEATCTPAAPGDLRCARDGRHVGWEERASIDPDLIARAWSAPGPGGFYGLGIACGPSRLLVVDLDTPKSPDAAAGRAGRRDSGGSAAEARRVAAERMVARLAELELPPDAHGARVLDAVRRAGGHDPLPETLAVATPSVGRHLYFALPEGVRAGSTASVIGPRVDTRASGGLIVCPPTRALDRGGVLRPYTPDAPRPVALAPRWLAEAVPGPQDPARRHSGATAPVVLRRGSGEWSREDAYLSAALRRQTEHVVTAPEGERNRALYVSACALGGLVAGNPGRADFAEAVERELTSAALAAGLTSHEVATTLRSGLRAGARRPRPVAASAA